MCSPFRKMWVVLVTSSCLKLALSASPFEALFSGSTLLLFPNCCTQASSRNKSGEIFQSYVWTRHIWVELIERWGNERYRARVTKQANNFWKGYQTHHLWNHTQTCLVIISSLFFVILPFLNFYLSLTFAHTHGITLRLIDCCDFYFSFVLNFVLEKNEKLFSSNNKKASKKSFVFNCLESSNFILNVC